MKKGKKKKAESKRRGSNSRHCSSDSTPHQSSVESSPQQNSLSCTPPQQWSSEFTPQQPCPESTPQQATSGSNPQQQQQSSEFTPQQHASGSTPRQPSLGSIVERPVIRALPAPQVTQDTCTKISNGSKKAGEQISSLSVLAFLLLNPGLPQKLFLLGRDAWLTCILELCCGE